MYGCLLILGDKWNITNHLLGQRRRHQDSSRLCPARPADDLPPFWQMPAASQSVHGGHSGGQRQTKGDITTPGQQKREISPTSSNQSNRDDDHLGLSYALCKMCFSSCLQLTQQVLRSNSLTATLIVGKCSQRIILRLLECLMSIT